MQFDILGPLQVLDAGRPLALGRPKQRAVLAILLLDAGRVVSLDRLVEELWGPQSPPQALASVQAYVSHLRRLLEPERAPGAPATVIVNQAPGYRLAVDPDDLDAARFQTLARKGHDLLRAGDAPRAAEVLEAALGLWRGPVLADLADAPFVQAERTRLEDLRLTALEDRLSADLRTDRHARIVAELEQLTAEHPFRERLQGLRMAALYRCGRQAEALRSYHDFRMRLREELGLDPGQALRDLERDILSQSAHLDAPAEHRGVPGPAPDGVPDPSRSAARKADVPVLSASDGLVGRDAQLRVIDRALTGTWAGRGRILLLAGEPGIGKTRLAEEAARRARESGVTVAWGRSDQDAGAPPFWPWTQVLRAVLGTGTGHLRTGGSSPDLDVAELARIVPELATDGEPAAAPVIDPETARFRLCHAATATLLQLARTRPLLVVLDDLQWADVASHRLLSHLATTLTDAPVVVLVTYRDRDLDGGQPLAETLAELARAPAVDRLQLTGLEVADVARIMASHGGTGPDDGLARLIGDRTGGNPFFVLEVLRLLGASGWPDRTTAEAAARVAQQVPAGVRDVLRRRLGRLPDQTRTLLLIAAVIGQEFDLDLVRAVTAVDDDEALAAVELTVSAGLVTEDPTRVGRFRFAHALIRETIYGEISLARRARLHARVGRALLDRRGDHDHVLQIAHHWWLAAPVVGAEQAIPHVMAAVELCLQTFAYEEAERQLRRSLELLATTPVSTERATAELPIQLRLGSLMVQLHGTGTEAARACFTRAQELAEELGDASARLAALRSLYEVAFARADHGVAGDLAHAMLGPAERSDDPATLVVSHMSLGRTLWCQGRLTAARVHLERALQVSTTVDQSRDFLPPRVPLQLQLAAVLGPLGESQEAARLLTRAVDEAQQGSPFAHAVAATGAALVAALARDRPSARAWATDALALAERWRLPTPGGYAAVVLGWLEALEGTSTDAPAAMRRHLATIEAGGAQHLLAWGQGLLAEAELRHDHPDEALRLLDDALVRVERTDERLYESELHRLRALALLAVDPPRRDDARTSLQRALTVAREQGSAVLQARAAASGAATGLSGHRGSESAPGLPPGDPLQTANPS